MCGRGGLENNLNYVGVEGVTAEGVDIILNYKGKGVSKVFISFGKTLG